MRAQDVVGVGERGRGGRVEAVGPLALVRPEQAGAGACAGGADKVAADSAAGAEEERGQRRRES